MHAHGKKPRQRNRPRNKANRLQASNEGGTDRDAKLGDSNNNTNNHKCTAVEKPQAQVTDKGTAVLEATQTNQVAIQSLYENNATIRLIQKLMREKFLKQGAPDGQNKSCNEMLKSNTNSKGESAKGPSSNRSLNGSTTEAQKVKLIEKLVTPEMATSTPHCVMEEFAEKNTFLANLQKKMGGVIAGELPNTLFDNLQKLINQDPVSDVESSDDEDEYIEYIYKPRQYFLTSLCNLCKSDLCDKELVLCTGCEMTYYCSVGHMRDDKEHRQLCYALKQVAESYGHHIFHKCGDFSTEQFRSYRIVNIRKAESVMNRSLTASEQEVVLFPRICCDSKCREYRFGKLVDCKTCGQIAYCKGKPTHFNELHQKWCDAFKLFKALIVHQTKFGRAAPSLPTKILRDLPGGCSSNKQIFSKLALDLKNQCEYAALTQISTVPLTAWYALKLCNQLKTSDMMTIHLIGAEIEFEVDALHKWEAFFLHITPSLKQLNVVFIGPELNQRNISFEQLKRTKTCRSCRTCSRSIKYHFENEFYHDYSKNANFLSPDLICFFNAGLYRCTGFQMEDTWPDTILAAANIKCPIVVTAYTAYEAPLDMTRVVQESNRRFNVVLPPTVNPFLSEKPERNFISEEEAPLMFKNYYCFVVE